MAKPDRLAWFPFYGRDFFMDEAVQTFNLRQSGIYLALLWHQWEHGSLPPLEECLRFPVFAKDQHDDFIFDYGPNVAARSTTQDDLKHVLNRCFPPHPSTSNRFANPRMLQVRLEQDRKNEVNQQRARKGGLAKSTSQARLKRTLSTSRSVLEACYSESEAESDSEHTKKEKRAPWFELFVLTEDLKTWCTDNSMPDPTLHLDEFLDHFRKTAGKMKSGQQVKDPAAAFRTWMRNTVKFSPVAPPTRPRQNILAKLDAHDAALPPADPEVMAEIAALVAQADRLKGPPERT